MKIRWAHPPRSIWLFYDFRWIAEGFWDTNIWGKVHYLQSTNRFPSYSLSACGLITRHGVKLLIESTGIVINYHRLLASTETIHILFLLFHLFHPHRTCTRTLFLLWNFVLFLNISLLLDSSFSFLFLISSYTCWILETICLTDFSVATRISDIHTTCMLSPDRANGRNISNGTSLKPLSDVH